MSHLAPGQVIADRYEIGPQLGVGGMARVYRGHDRLLDRPVAIKVLAERYAADPNFVERFRREASAAAGLNHPNIVAVYDRGQTDDSYYIVMEYLEGPDLKRVIRERGRLSPADAVTYAIQILSALGAAHRRDIVHRDIKPQNVMANADGVLKVTDFGIARAGAESDVTEVGSVIGTAQYLSPEQARGGDVTAASDCYSLGIVLFEMLTGRLPFDGERPVEVALKQVNEPPPSPQSLEPSIPDDLNAIVLMALQKRPSDRFRTAEEFARALQQSQSRAGGATATRLMPAAAGAGPATEATRAIPRQSTAPTRVAPRRPPAPPPPPPRRRWPIVVVIGAFLAVAGIAGAFLLLGGGEDTVTIPDVSGQPAPAANNQLRELELIPVPERVASDTVDPGLVIGTDPPALRDVARDSEVRVMVSSGPAAIPVPGVVGDPVAVAQTTLTEARFRVDPQVVPSDDVPEGEVISQDPAGGDEAQPDSVVTLQVSGGPEQATVPQLVGRDRDEAEDVIIAAGLLLDEVRSCETNQFDPGTVVEQDPPARTQVDARSDVSICTAIPPSSVTLPDVTGLDESEALRRLGLEGFDRVMIEDAEPFTDEPAGIVLDQSPDGDSEVSPGQAVTLIVSLGPVEDEPPPEDGSDESGDGDDSGIE